MMEHDDIVSYVKKHYPGHAILLIPGFESAFVGVTEEGLYSPCAVYDYMQCVEVLISTEDMSVKEAINHLEDVIKMDLGDYSPHFVRTFSKFFSEYALN